MSVADDTNIIINKLHGNVTAVKGFKGAVFAPSCGSHATSMSEAFFKMHNMKRAFN